MTRKTFFFEGRELPFEGPGFAGAQLLGSNGSRAPIPGPEEPPYLFCSNGSCRDCNLLVDGFSDLPACRVPLAPGMSLRSGEGAGEENALSRRLGRLPAGDPVVAEVFVLGAGVSGRAAAEESRRRGAETVAVDARSGEQEFVRARCPAGVADGKLFLHEEGRRREVRARAIVLANGARDATPRFPGATLAGVLPLDLLSRYLDLGQLPGRSFLAEGAPPVVERVSGRVRVERVAIAGGREFEVDLVFVRPGREPALELAKALGCRTVFDPSLGQERLVLEDGVRTSVPGVFACGDVAAFRDETRAAESGRRAGRAAAELVIAKRAAL
jgi:pyruvate/2-oxoglutarate dehydrogenase complex dihydrolipoamide dehydrogenase (E3) component